MVCETVPVSPPPPTCVGVVGALTNLQGVKQAVFHGVQRQPGSVWGHSGLVRRDRPRSTPKVSPYLQLGSVKLGMTDDDMLDVVCPPTRLPLPATYP